jgi:nitric oxide reductase NorD protein
VFEGDVSASAGEPAEGGKTVHEQQRAAAAALTLALHELGDRVALYAYHSQGRASVRLMPVKRFGEGAGPLLLQRLGSLEPAAYSRLGAAIRHGTALLQDHGGTPRQLLVVLSDGLAYDHGYEPAYGAADAHRALGEARSQGVACLCLSIGASTDHESLRKVFGRFAHAALSSPDHLSQSIAPLFRSAIRSADIRRRIA